MALQHGIQLLLQVGQRLGRLVPGGGGIGQLALGLGDRRLVLATDGLGPFRVATDTP